MRRTVDHLACNVSRRLLLVRVNLADIVVDTPPPPPRPGMQPSPYPSYTSGNATAGSSGLGGQPLVGHALNTVERFTSRRTRQELERGVNDVMQRESAISRRSACCSLIRMSSVFKVRVQVHEVTVRGLAAA